MRGAEYHPTDYLPITKERRYLYSGEVWQSPSYTQVIKFILGPCGTIWYYVPPDVLQEEAYSFTYVVFVLKMFHLNLIEV